MRYRELRAFVIGPIEGGSLAVARHAAAGLEENGARVDFLDFSSLAPRGSMRRPSARSSEARMHLMRYASALVVEEARRARPDLILVLAQAPLTGEAAAELRGRQIPTVFWFVENYRVTESWRALAGRFDWFFTLQRGRFHRLLKEAGAPRVGFLPLACDPNRYRPLRLSPASRERYRAEVGFAGYGYFNRRDFLAGLSDFNLKIWGPGWEASAVERFVQEGGRPFSERDFVRIASAGAIQINLHSATHVGGVDPDGDYLNPRVFDLAACGAFQICDRRTDLPEFFEPEREIPAYGSIEELREKIRHYLERPEERAAVAAAARRRALAEHTYRHRMAALLDQVFGGRPAPTPPAADPLARLDQLSAEPRVSEEEILLRLALGDGKVA